MQKFLILEQDIIKNGLSVSCYPYNYINDMIKQMSFYSKQEKIRCLQKRLIKVLTCIEFAEKSSLGAAKKEQIKLTWGVVAMSIALEIVSKHNK